MSLIHLSTELRQELKLTPQLLQSMELLQMNSQELLDYLNQVSEENPLVEQTDLSSLHKAYEALRQKVHWINGGLPEDGHGAMPDRGAADRETESLSAFLCDQLERRRLPKPLLALTRYLAELVDEEGRLSQEDLDGVADLKIPQALTQQALETLQSLDPAGVGAGPCRSACCCSWPGRMLPPPWIWRSSAASCRTWARSITASLPGNSIPRQRRSGRRKSGSLPWIPAPAAPSSRRSPHSMSGRICSSRNWTESSR